MERSSPEAYLQLGRTLSPAAAAAGRLDTTGAVRLTFNHTHLLPCAVRRLGDILGHIFRRLWRKHVRVALLSFGLSPPIKVGGQKSAVGKRSVLFLEIRAHSGSTSFFLVLSFGVEGFWSEDVHEERAGKAASNYDFCRKSQLHGPTRRISALGLKDDL